MRPNWDDVFLANGRVPAPELKLHTFSKTHAEFLQDLGIQWNLSNQNLYIKETSLLRTLIQVPYQYFAVYIRNKETSIIRTNFEVPTIERFHCRGGTDNCQKALTHLNTYLKVTIINTDYF